MEKVNIQKEKRIYGKQLKFYRHYNDLTLVELSDKLDITDGYLSRIENGKATVGFKLLLKIKALTGITL